MNKIYSLFILSCISGMLAVLIGAFGAHGLEGKIPHDSLLSYKTGVNYQFYHTLASLISLSLFLKFRDKYFRWSSIFFLIGILCFSGSLYLLTTRTITNISFTNILGPITPIGGLLLATGWALLAVGIMSVKNSNIE